MDSSEACWGESIPAWKTDGRGNDSAVLDKIQWLDRLSVHTSRETLVLIRYHDHSQ